MPNEIERIAGGVPEDPNAPLRDYGADTIKWNRVSQHAERGEASESISADEAVAELIDRGVVSDEQQAMALMDQAVKNNESIELPETDKKYPGSIFGEKQIAEQIPDSPDAPDAPREQDHRSESERDMERVVASFQSGVKRVGQSKGVIVIFFENGQDLVLYPDGKWFG